MDLKVASDHMLKVAVVLLNYNGKGLMERMLPVLTQSLDVNEHVKLFIVDNASTDDSLIFLTENFPDLEVIRFDKNHGYTGGFNLALEMIKAEYYLTLSSDVEVTKGWMDSMLTYMESHPEIGACQPKVMSYYDKSKFEYAGAAGGFMDAWGYLFCRGRVFDHIEVDRGQYDEGSDVFWAGGCSLMVRGHVFHELGGFDTDFFAHFEEVDLCWRMRGLGYRVGVCPESVVFHMGGSTLDYEDPRKLYLNSRNNLIMLFKNWPLTDLIFKMPLRFLLDWVGSFYFLKTRDFAAFKAVYKAHFHFLIGIRQWSRKRKTTRRSTTSRSKIGEYKRSVVWDYFIKKNKTFDALRW